MTDTISSDPIMTKIIWNLGYCPLSETNAEASEEADVGFSGGTYVYLQ